MIEDIRLKTKGAVWYHTDDYASPSLSKASLGLFLYEVLKEGAQIGNIYAFNHNYDRSPVYFSIYMTEDMKNNIESRTKFKFKLPPKININ